MTKFSQSSGYKKTGKPDIPRKLETHWGCIIPLLAFSIIMGIIWWVAYIFE